MAEISKSLFETGQARPPRSSREEAIPDLLKTADVVRKRIAHQVGSFGVTAQQYNILRILRGAGPAGSSVSAPATTAAWFIAACHLPAWTCSTNSTRSSARRLRKSSTT